MAVQVRVVLLICLPLTGSEVSVEVTIKLLSQASLNCGVPNAGAAGHSMVASAGQLTTVGG